jgi:acetyltransferase-like isoleucine patch superfamily enzyme
MSDSNFHFSVKIGHNTIISKNIQIGKNVTIGNNVVIHEGVIINDNVILSDNSVIGCKPQPRKSSSNKTKSLFQTILGTNVFVGYASILYAGVQINSNSYVADMVWVRENSQIGSNSVLGTKCSIMNSVRIGNNSRVMNNSQITEFTQIGNDVFIGPDVSTVSDNDFGRGKNQYNPKPIVINDKSRLGGNCTILPGIEIGKNSIVAAGSVVVRDVPSNVLVLGNPARQLRTLE